MTYKKQRNRWIFLVLLLPIIGVLRFIMSIVFFVIDLVGAEQGNITVPTTEVAVEQQLDIWTWTTWLSLGTETTQRESFSNAIRWFINRILWIIALFGIPWTIAGIIMLTTNKKDEERTQNTIQKTQAIQWTTLGWEEAGNANSTVEKQKEPYTGYVYGSGPWEVIRLWRDTLMKEKIERVSRWQLQVASALLWLGIAFLTIIMSIFWKTTGGDPSWLSIEPTDTMFSLLTLVVVWWLRIFFGLRLTIWRLKDMDRPWTHIFLFLIPFYNIYMLIILYFETWSTWTNTYGNDPLAYQSKDDGWYRWVVILVDLIVVSMTFRSLQYIW